MPNAEWNDGSKRFVPRSRGRRGHTYTFGCNLSRGRMASLCRAAERRVRQASRKLCEISA